MSETGSVRRADSPDSEIVFRVHDGDRDEDEHDDVGGQGDIPIRDDPRPDDADHFARIQRRKLPNREAQDEFHPLPERSPVPNNHVFQEGPRPFYRYPPAMMRDGPVTGTTIKPEAYNGRDSWEEYISHFENCAELGRWSDTEKVLVLSASLRGPARTYYISLTAAEKRSYYLLVRNMEQRFGNVRHQNRWLSRFETRTRKPNEPIATLGDDLRQMAQKAYSNLDTRAQEVLALNQLYKNISLEMKCRCIDKECRNVSEAVDLIERYEALLGETGESRRKMNVRQVTGADSSPKTTIPNQTSTDQDTSNLIHQLLNRIEKLERGPQTSKSFNCFNCNSPDHLFRNCPRNRRKIDQNPMSGASNGYNQHRNPNNQGNYRYNQRVQGNGKPSAYQA